MYPQVIYGQAPPVVLSIVSLSYLTLAVPLSLAQLARPVPPAKQKLAAFFSLYVLTWIFLVLATVALQRWHISGLYWVGAWNACALLAVIVGAVEGLTGSGKAGREVPTDAVEVEGENREAGKRKAVQAASNEPTEEQAASPSHNVWDSIGHSDSHSTAHDNREQRDEEDGEEPTERTPLMSARTRKVTVNKDVVLNEKVQDRALFWWILQCIFEVPIPISLLGTVIFLWVGSMSQSVLDGGPVGAGECADSKSISLEVLLNCFAVSSSIHPTIATLCPRNTPARPFRAQDAPILHNPRFRRLLGQHALLMVDIPIR